jgi:hypothetical protein
MVQVADVDASTETEDALSLAPAYLEGQPGMIDCINVGRERVLRGSSHVTAIQKPWLWLVSGAMLAVHAEVGFRKLQRQRQPAQHCLQNLT